MEHKSASSYLYKYLLKMSVFELKPYEICRWTLANKLFRPQIRKKFRNWKKKVAKNPDSTGLALVKKS